MSESLPQPTPDVSSFFVVVPFFNEARGMQATLDALATQSDIAFSVVLVDNASSDASGTVAARFAAADNAPRTFLVHETQKGTGAAADTGFRVAIARGARWIARTDADCIPDRNWVRHMKIALSRDGLEFVAGQILPRTDEGPLSPISHFILRSMVRLAENFGKLHRRGPQFKYPYFMAAGNNLAITATLYEKCGGFPRTAIEELHEDRVLSEKVRTLTHRAALRREVVVYNSVRRVRAYGYLNTLRWYRNHGYRSGVVDVR